MFILNVEHIVLLEVIGVFRLQRVLVTHLKQETLDVKVSCLGLLRLRIRVSPNIFWRTLPFTCLINNTMLFLFLQVVITHTALVRGSLVSISSLQSVK